MEGIRAIQQRYSTRSGGNSSVSVCEVKRWQKAVLLYKTNAVIRFFVYLKRYILNCKTWPLKWPLCDKECTINPSQPSLRGKPCSEGQLGSSTGPKEASNGGARGHLKGVLLLTKWRLWENTDMARGAGRSRISFLREPKLKQIHHEGSGEVCPKLPGHVSFRSKVTTLRKSKLNLQCPCCGFSAAEVHWSAQEMRTGVWARSFFWVSAKPLWPLKEDITPGFRARVSIARHGGPPCRFPVQPKTPWMMMHDQHSLNQSGGAQ